VPVLVHGSVGMGVLVVPLGGSATVTDVGGFNDRKKVVMIMAKLCMVTMVADL
jgi:hypothetical protein